MAVGARMDDKVSNDGHEELDITPYLKALMVSKHRWDIFAKLPAHVQSGYLSRILDDALEEAIESNPNVLTPYFLEP